MYVLVSFSLAFRAPRIDILSSGCPSSSLLAVRADVRPAGPVVLQVRPERRRRDLLAALRARNRRRVRGGALKKGGELVAAGIRALGL